MSRSEILKLEEEAVQLYFRLIFQQTVHEERTDSELREDKCPAFVPRRETHTTESNANQTSRRNQVSSQKEATTQPS
jgi:hypothetical protein